MTREEHIAALEKYRDGILSGGISVPYDDLMIALDASIAALREPAHEWVRTTDRLPEPWVTVLLWNGDEKVSGYANDNGDLIEHRWGLVFRATHWMLPEPPGEEAEKMEECEVCINNANILNDYDI